MNIIIIRHGESEADLLNVHEGRADFPLTKKGKEQAILLADWMLGNEVVDLIVASPLLRARSTAESIGERFGLNIIYDDDLMEWNNGLLAGLGREEADKLYPIPEGGKKPHHEFAESESMINFRARAEKFLSRMYEERSTVENICIVTHGGMSNMLYRSLMSLPMTSEHSISCGDTALSKYKVKDGCCHIEYINKSEHLRG